MRPIQKGERNAVDRSLPSLAARAALALGLSLGLCPEALAVYDVKPGEIRGKSGSIIRVWPLEGGGPGGGDAFRILYRSTGLNGEPIAVSGAIFIPPGPAPARGRNVIAWAHPTSGVVEACAPSLMPDVSGMIWGLADMLAQGYVVVATDYPGLGMPGQIHPYLIGVSEGRAVLDSVRAAQRCRARALRTVSRCGATAKAAMPRSIPESLLQAMRPSLKLVGVAAAAPATYLVELFDAEKSTATGKELTAMTLYSWSKLYNTPASSLVEPAAMAPFQRMAHDCIESLAEFAAIEKAEKPLDRIQFLKADPTEIEPWRGIMQRNTPGQAAAGAPVFIAQGTADTTVRPDITKQFAVALCRQGARVRFVSLNGVSHTFAAKESVGQALAWMGDRFRGRRRRRTADASVALLRSVS